MGRWNLSALCIPAYLGLLATGLVGASAPQPAWAGIDDRYNLSLPSQDLAKTLVNLGEQSKISIVFSDQVVSGIKASALQGEFNLPQALKRVLAETGLSYRVISNRAIAIIPQQPHLAFSEDLPDAAESLFYIEDLLIEGRRITGSRLRQNYTNGFAPVEILSGSELRLSGAQSLSDLLKFIPVISGNSTSTAVSNGGDGTATVTLRGLPASNTLVLLNGTRIASNGFGGDAVDINTIPVAAIDRIEILKDGASAIYGSDAIAGVVNIILRKYYDGARLETYYGESSRKDNNTATASLIWGGEGPHSSFMMAANHFSQNGFLSRDRELSSNADGRRLGGSDKRSTATEAARITLDERTLILANGEDGDHPDDFRIATDEDLFNYLQFTSSLSPSERSSIYFNSLFDLTDHVSATLSANYTQTSTEITFAPTPVFTGFEAVPLPIAADQSYNPFGAEVVDVRRRMLEIGPRIQENRNRAARISTGLNGNFMDWEWSLAYNWSRTRAHEYFVGLINALRLQQALGSPRQCTGGCVAVNLFGPAGSLDAEQAAFLRTGSSSAGDTELRNLTADFSTNLWDLPAGTVGLAFGMEMRHESIDIQPDILTAQGVLLGGANFTSSTGSRNIMEGYMEWMMPLLAERPGIKKLDLNIAVRGSHYSDFGNTVNPKMSVRYQPVSQWVLRSTYSEGFRAPSLIELFKGNSQHQATLSDPCSKPENVGVLPGCVQQSDPLRSQYLTLLGGNENLLAETSHNFSLGAVWQPDFIKSLSLSIDYFRIDQNNVIDANAQFFVTSNAELGLFSDRVLRDNEGEIVQVISTEANLGDRLISGIDFGASWHYTFDNFGTIATNLSATHLREYLSQISTLSQPQDLAGTFADAAADGNGTLPEWKIHFSVYWQLAQWETAWSINHISPLSEIVPDLGKERIISSWTTHDLQMSYLFSQDSARVTLGIDNVLDALPPFAASAFNDNFDSRNYDGTGRFWYAKLAYDF